MFVGNQHLFDPLRPIGGVRGNPRNPFNDGFFQDPFGSTLNGHFSDPGNGQ